MIGSAGSGRVATRRNQSTDFRSAWFVCSDVYLTTRPASAKPRYEELATSCLSMYCASDLTPLRNLNSISRRTV